MFKAFVFAISLLAMSSLYAQEVYISRYIPDFPANSENPEQEVEIFNESRNRVLNLQGYLLATRSYMIRLPNLEIPPLKSIRLGMKEHGMGAYFSMLDMRDFHFRQSFGSEEGDFIILMDRNRRVKDAFYFSEQEEVDFLPISESFYTESGTEIRFTTPPEQHEDWSFYQVEPDPAMSFVKINGTWTPNTRHGNMFSATEYRYLQTKYVEGTVTLRWQTEFERDCFQHVVERKLGDDLYREIGRLPSKIQNSTQPIDYEYHDREVLEDQVYFYRIRNIDKFGGVIYSEEIEAATEENPGGFYFDVLSDPSDQGQYLNIRFSSRRKQRVRILLLDEELRQLAILFADDIEGDKQNLITYNEPIPFGIYHILFETDKRRYRELLVVE